MSVPDACEVAAGRGPILLVAPHGGHRPPVDAAAPPAGLRVNDLYTPEVTRLLGAALRAGYIINEQIDRNVLDLNRVSQIRRRARWFLELLVAAIDRIIGQHGRAELLFVHGWNTGGPKCDIGIGAEETRRGLHVPNGARLSVTEDYLRARVQPLRSACAAAGIVAPIGERYPASHHNNLVQACTPRHLDSEDVLLRRLARWAGAGQLNALQLELSIPLRWPGSWRDRFIAAVTKAFDHQSGSPGDVAAGDRPRHRGPRADLGGRPVALQFYDAAADVGLFAGIGRMGPTAIGGRLLLFLGGQRIALFTGEERGTGVAGVPPLCMRPENAGLRLAFSGPLLRLEDGTTYLDLEAALAASRLVDAHVDMRFAAGGETTGAQFGTVEGCIAVDRQRWHVHAGAFANAGALRATGTQQQTMIAADFGAGGAVLARVVEAPEGSMGVHFAGKHARPLQELRVVVSTDGDAYTPVALRLSLAEHPSLDGWALSRMAILRPAGRGDYLRVTFGVGRFRWGAAEGYGLYEHARPLHACTSNLE